MRKTAQLQVALDMIEDPFVREAIQSVVLFCNSLVGKGLDSGARLSGKTFQNHDGRFSVDGEGQLTAKAFATFGSGVLQGDQGTTEVPSFWRTSVREGILEAAFGSVDLVVEGRVLGAVGFTQYDGYMLNRLDSIADTDVDPVGNTLTFVGHGLANGDSGYFQDMGLGFTLPDPLAYRTLYYVVGVTADTFQLSLTRGGAAIDITDTGGAAETFIFGAGGPGFMQVMTARVDPTGPDNDEDVVYFSAASSNESNIVRIQNGSELNLNFYRVLIFYTDDLT